MFGLGQSEIDEISGVFKKYKNIKRVLIFGSRSKGNYKEGSDIDLAIEGDEVDFNQILTILADIDDLELLHNVDLINYQEKKDTPIGEHIARVGKVFYIRE
ncbi:MAG: nucleotidyltransferase domain-containing protein [Bacteroidales bacterium]|nr:nucleotidyltransferase domain-containing protein [Bacteroidales bacterium]